MKVVFTEPASAAGHVIDAARLAELYGDGATARSHAAEALAHARELAGPQGNVLVCGSLYLAGEVLAMSRSHTEGGAG